MLRLLDLIIALIAIIVIIPIIIIIYVVLLFDTDSPIFSQTRVGRYQEPFKLFKFRTMHTDTPWIASHLVEPSSVTSIGYFLRRTKIDELPQLWNVIKGEMSIVGPRPCLFSQELLIRERAAHLVFSVRPGITGLAQIMGIDMSEPLLLAETDAKMIRELSLFNYCKIIVMTIAGMGRGDRVKR